MKSRYNLRGGGCGNTKINPSQQSNQKTDKDVYDFFSKFNQYIDILLNKASVASNQQESNEIMVAIQWFIYYEENIYKLNKNIESVKKSYDLILDGIRKLLKSCLIYIRTDSFKCLYILQITASLSKIIFSFHLMNDDRYMKCVTQNEFLEISNDLQQQIEIEKDDLFQNQLEFYLFLTKTSFQIAPNNSKEKEEILKGCLKGIISSVVKMSPDAELLDSLFRGACLLYSIYDINQKRKQYEVYYQVDMLQWEIIGYFKNDKNKNLQEIISQIEAIYEKLVKFSNNWNDHYCWIQMIGKLLIYNPQINKQRLSHTQNYSQNQEKNTLDYAWKDLIKKKIAILTNNSNDQAIILLDQLVNKNNKLNETDKIIIETCFVGWENFILFKEYLMDDLRISQQQFKPYTLGAYIKSKLDIGEENFKKNENLEILDRIQKIHSFLLSKEISNLIQLNDEKLQVIIKNLRNCMRNRIINVKITQSTYKQQIKQIISNYQEYLQNTIKIIRYFNFNQKQIYSIIKKLQGRDQQVMNQSSQIIYQIKLLDSIIQQQIQDVKYNREDENSQSKQSSNNFNEIKLFYEEKEAIKMELFKLNDLKGEAQQIVQGLKQHLLSLNNATQDKQKFMNQALNTLNFIQNSLVEMNNLQNQEIENSNLVQCFENLLNNIYLYYQENSVKLEKNYDDSFQVLQKLITMKFDIEAASQLNDLSRITQKFQNLQINNQMLCLQLEMLKLQLKFQTLDDTFQNIQKYAKSDSENLQKLNGIINFEQFLIDLIKNYPFRISRFNTKVQKQVIAELKTMKISEEDYQQKFSTQKGIVEYYIFKLIIEEQINQSEIVEIELLEKEFGEFFIEELPQTIITEKIYKIIQHLKINESLKLINEQQFNQSSLQIQQDKFENALSQLRIIKESKKNISKDDITYDHLQIMINQIQKIIKAIQICHTINLEIKPIKEILKIPIKEELEELQNIQNKFLHFQKGLPENKIILENQIKQIDDEENQLKEEMNQKNQKQLDEQTISNIRVFDKVLVQDQINYIDNNKKNQYEKNLQLQNNESFRTNLQIILKVIKLQQMRIKEDKEFLNSLLLVVQNFSDQLFEFIENQKRESQQKIYEQLNLYFQEQTRKFESAQLTTVNIEQQDNEIFSKYVDRLQIQLIQLENDSDQKVDQIQDTEQTNIQDFLIKLKDNIIEKLIEKSFIQQQIQIDQELLIHQIFRIFISQNIQSTFEEPNQQLGYFDKLQQKYQDFKNNNEWKIKQGLVFSIIQVSSNCLNNQILSYCQIILIQLWTQEKDYRIRNLLKNQDLISMQMQILQKNWNSQHDRIASEMQKMLQQIDELQESIYHESDLNKRDEQLQELDETTQQLDEYIENISEMGQQLKLITDFVNQIRKSLARVEGKINQMKEQLNNIGNDVKFLRGKSVEQLLQIRKWKVLKEAAQNNVQSIYVPLHTQEKGQSNYSNLLNIEQYDDNECQVNKFLQEEKTILLIHGIAGSGKSKTAKIIEEFIWKLHDKNIKIKNQVLIPIYISLPSLQNPVYSAVEETLHQDEYGFDDLQLREFKEILEKREFRLLLIMDSYDEMKLENISKNLYVSNKILQNWSNPLLVFTTRSEIFTSKNYADWFTTQNKEKEFKEIQILKFNKTQQKEYLKKFAIFSLKMLIFELFEWQAQIQKDRQLDIQKFEQSWDKLFQQLIKYNLEKSKSDLLLNQKLIMMILSFLKNDIFLGKISQEAIKSLQINLQKLWSVHKYKKMIKMINLDKLAETPYMMEIVVQVLPLMQGNTTEINNLRKLFNNNFSKSLQEFIKSSYSIKFYQEEQRKFINQKILEPQNDQLLINLEQLEQIKSNQDDLVRLKVLLDEIDYNELAIQFWNQIEQNQILKDFLITQEMNELKLKMQHNLQLNFINYQINLQEILKILVIKNESIFDLLCEALKDQNLSNYDFYDKFTQQYQLKQIEKLKNLGKSINADRFYHDLIKYQIKLSKQLSSKQVTQVQFKQQGLLYADDNQEEEWLNEFFNDDYKNGSYKKDIRSCSLVQQKGTKFQFVHKSIQEFFIAVDLYELLILSKDVDVKLFDTIIEQYCQKNNNDFLSIFQEQQVKEKQYKSLILTHTLSSYEKKQQLNQIEYNIKKLIDLIKLIQMHQFNAINYSTKVYEESRRFLIQKISKVENVIEFLKFLVRLTAIDESFFQCGSNSLNLLVDMKVDLTRQSFTNIRIKNTSLIGSSFAKSNLSGSKFENVNVNGINLNGSLLFNCQWDKIQINELFKMEGHSEGVLSVCFSPDGMILASCSDDQFIFFWDVKSGQLKKKLEGHKGRVSSVCFSTDSNTLASGGYDKFIFLWNVQSDQIPIKLEGHNQAILSICFSPDGVTLASGSQDKCIILWNVNSGQINKKLEGHSGSILSICFSPDSKILASGSRDQSIKLWDVKQGEIKQNLRGHSDIVNSVCYSPNGDTLASGSSDNSILLWDVKIGEQINKLEGHSQSIFSICFSPDGQKLASASWDQSIRLWDIKTGKEKNVLYGHDGGVYSVCYSPDGALLASGSYDNSIRLWDVNSVDENNKLGGHSGYISSVCFSPDCTTLASGGNDYSICLWDVQTCKQKNELYGHSGEVYSICYSPDGALLASGSCDNSIRLWDVRKGAEQKILKGHTKSVRSIVFSSDGTMLASGSSDTTISIWDIILGEEKKKLEGHLWSVNSVCFSSDGLILASGSDDKSIRLWDIILGIQKKKLNGHNDGILSLCFSPDCTILASSSTDKSIRLWDMKTGQEKKKLEGHKGGISTICFNFDGSVLISGSQDTSIRIWDVDSGQEKIQLKGHNGGVLSVCLSPDGGALASGSEDMSIRLWDLPIRSEFQQHQAFQSKLSGQFKNFNQQNNKCRKMDDTISIFRISKQQQFEAQSALISDSQFFNHLEMDLRRLLEQKGCKLLEKQAQQNLISN